MAGSRIAKPFSGWWCQMQNQISQAGKPLQALPVIQIGEQRDGAGSAPISSTPDVAQHGMHLVAPGKTGKNAAGNVPAADNQDFLHAGIVADDQGEEMSHQITVQPSGRQFSAEMDETLLDAALRQGLTLPHGCKDGACGSCKGKVLSGTVDHGKAQDHSLTPAERDAGLTLYCCAKAISDLVIECKQLGSSSDFPVKTLPARIEKLDKLAPDVIEMHLRLPANERLQFRAGQYIDILLKDGRKRSFSLANAPQDEAMLQLHIRHVPGGVFTDQVFSTQKVRDILRFNGPHGSFYLRNDSNKPAILLAGGTGFAPIKAMVEQCIAEQSTRPIHIYWGAKARVDLYQHALPERWRTEHAQITYTPVLAEPTADDTWPGRSGLVHRAVMADFPDLSGYEVYACGSPGMIDAARRDFTSQCGLPEEAFFADAFTFSAN